MNTEICLNTQKPMKMQESALMLLWFSVKQMNSLQKRINFDGITLFLSARIYVFRALTPHLQMNFLKLLGPAFVSSAMKCCAM